MTPVFLAVLWFQIALAPPVPDLNPGALDLLPPHFAGLPGGRVQKFTPSELPGLSGEDAAVVGEFGFLGAERKEFVRGERRVTVEVLRMRDASAAYGVFTFYRRADWRADGETGQFHFATGSGQAVLLRRSYCVRILGLEPSREELAALANALPAAPDEPLPPLRDFLPEQGVVRASLKYAIGPQAASRMIPQIPPELLGFAKGAEVQMAQYRWPGKPPLTLVLVNYPTPQLAMTGLKNLEEQSPTWRIKRTGALLSVVLDAGTPHDADLLLNRVRYAMDLTWNQAAPKNRSPTWTDAAHLILAIFKLAGILLVFCLLSGLAFGGLRVLGKRLFPGTLFDRDVEMIRLNLNS